MLMFAKTKSRAGVKSRRLWTAKSGYAETPGRGSVSLTSNVRYIKNHKQKTVIRNQRAAAKPVRRSVTLQSWGIYAAGIEKGKQIRREGQRPVGCKA